MGIASRLLELAAARPREALTDIVGLAAICAMVFVGFAVTAAA